MLGRSFYADEGASGAPCVTVLSDRLWRQGFNEDPQILGRAITLNGEPCTVVGVAPGKFEFPAGFDRGLWVPIRPDGPVFKDRGSHFLKTVGRLRLGAT